MIKSFKSNKGFTLVELIIVIAILAIIMLIAIPNFSGIQQRMQVRADKSTAAQIGKAVRVWFTDYTTDSGLVANADADAYVPVEVKDADGDVINPGLPTINDASAVAYDKLAGIEEYITVGQKPSSLKESAADGAKTAEHQAYCITLKANATSSEAKILVSICPGAEETVDPDTAVSGDEYTVVNPSAFPTVWTAADYNGTAAAVAYIEP